MKNRTYFCLICLWLPLVAIAQPDTLWTRMFGGALADQFNAIAETADHNLVFAGESQSFSVGLRDFWLVRADSIGDTLWTRNYGGTQDDACYAVQQTSDSGFILAGRSNSFGGGWSGYAVRTNASGDTLWTRSFGGAQRDEFASVVQTADSGFLFAGYTQSRGAGGGDFWLVKANANGDSLWSHTYGGSRLDQCYAIQPAADGGYYLGGSTESFGNGQSTSPDFWLVKVSASGDSLWSRAYGGTGSDVCNALTTVSDGCVLAGYTQSFGAGNADFWAVKVSGSGDSVTSRTFGTERQDFCQMVRPTVDGGLILAGDVDRGAAGSNNFWLIRTDANLDSLWNSVFGWQSVEHCRAAVETSDGSFITTGQTYSIGPGIPNAWVVASTTPFQFLRSYPDSVRFPNTLVGAHRDTTITLRNEGTYVCHVTDIQAPHGFMTSFSGDYAILPMAELQVFLRFEPDSAGIFDDSLRVYNSSLMNPLAIPLHAMGVSSAVEEREGRIIPREYTLQVSPNPFNPTTTLAFDVPKESRVRILVYDVNGRLEETLTDRSFAAGRYRVTFDGSRLSSGTYFARMEGTAFSRIKKLVLMK